jgi:hypothetical protein
MDDDQQSILAFASAKQCRTRSVHLAGVGTLPKVFRLASLCRRWCRVDPVSRNIDAAAKSLKRARLGASCS